MLSIPNRFSRAQVSQGPVIPAQPFTVPSSYVPEPAFYNRPLDGYRRGSFQVALAATGLTLDTDRHDTLGFATFGAEYFLSRAVSVNAEFDLSPGTFDPGTDSDDCWFDLDHARYFNRAYGGLLLLRARVIRTRRVSFYFDGGIGGLSANGAFPAQGNRANWMQAVGVGVTFRPGASASWFAGVRYVRLASDFFQQPTTRAFNGVQYYMGLTIRV